MHAILVIGSEHGQLDGWMGVEVNLQYLVLFNNRFLHTSRNFVFYFFLFINISFTCSWHSLTICHVSSCTDLCCWHSPALHSVCTMSKYVLGRMLTTVCTNRKEIIQTQFKENKTRTIKQCWWKKCTDVLFET